MKKYEAPVVEVEVFGVGEVMSEVYLPANFVPPENDLPLVP